MITISLTKTISVEHDGTACVLKHSGGLFSLNLNQAIEKVRQAMTRRVPVRKAR